MPLFPTVELTLRIYDFILWKGRENEKGVWPYDQTPCFQANTQIRTGDLILTKDVLYQLSHSSKHKDISSWRLIIIANNFAFVNTFFEK